MMKEKKITTAKDIAKACGISQATVSYVMNNKEGKKISDKTRQLVLETARQLDYIPNSSARTMRTNKAMSIGVVTERNCINLGFSRVLSGVKRYADTKGYSINLLSDDDTMENKHLEYINYFRANKIDGILFMFYDMDETVLAALENNHIPYLIINERGVWGKDREHKTTFMDVVTQCVRFCKDNELKKMRFISAVANGSGRSYKYNSFEQVVSTDFPDADFQRVFCRGKTGSNQEIIEKLEEYMEEDMDIVITPNHRIGLLTQSAILKKCLTTPQHIKHICLGASHIFHMIYPTITSVKIPLGEMGEYGAMALIGMINGADYEEKEFECTLEYGMSTNL